jgi:type VI protein secretion system component Hcp
MLTFTTSLAGEYVAWRNHTIAELQKFFRRNTTGANELQQTVTLANATISDFRQYVADDGRWLEDIAFVFQHIQIENIPSKTVAADSW